MTCYITTPYRRFSRQELLVLSQLKNLTPVNMVLDNVAVEFLLEQNTSNRKVNTARVTTIRRSIRRHGWHPTETLSVTSECKLGNGQHRLLALKGLDYPTDINATVVFGVDKKAMLVIDQHQKRSSAAAIKIHTGKSYSNTALAVVRYGWACDTFPGRMSLTTGAIGSLTPDILSEHLPAWARYFEAMPLLFSGKTFGSSMVKLTAPMALAVVHYAQRAGVTMANDFLEGFFGEKEVTADSPAHKALLFRLTQKRTSGSTAADHHYRVFVSFLLAHFVRRNNPQARAATSWGFLQTQTERKGGVK